MKTTSENTLSNLKTAITNEFKARREDFIKSLAECTTVEEILSSWRYKDLMTVGSKKLKWTETGLKCYLIERYDKKQANAILDKIFELNKVLEAGELTSIKIQVEWTKSRTWGANPKAECWYRFKTNLGNDSNYIKGSSIGGCGYDKLSTSVAEVLNQIPELKKAMYLFKEDNSTVKNHELFGYGSGYGILPQFEGGVGVSCYNTIFNKIGYTFRNVASGKTFDVYEINKL
jgi:hypothetical protein